MNHEKAIVILVSLTGLLATRGNPAVTAQPKPPATTRLWHSPDFIQHLRWSADGKKFLFTRIHAGKMGLWTMNADGGDVKPLLPKEAMPHFDGHFSPDGKKIVFVYDKLQGTDGKLQIDIINSDGTEHKNFLPHKAFEESPRFAPDGKSIAFVSTRDKNQEIYVVDLAGKNLQRLTNDEGFDNNPNWSPDGKQLVFASSRAGNFDIYTMDAGGGNVRRLTNHPRLDCWPIFSPDGKRIAFTSNRDGQFEIYIMDADGSNQRNFTQHSAHDNFAAWSPTGDRLAFISNRAGGYGIYIQEVK